ncbi:MAG: histidinol-phosphate transaminase [Planctomycetota bacterium]
MPATLPGSPMTAPAPRSNIADLHAYTPGEQPTWADTAHPTRPTIKLNTNENPYPPAPAVLDAIAALPAEALRLYPPPASDCFRQAAGDAHGLSPGHILATNGGDELLRMLITCYCDVGETTGGIGTTDPTYSLYPVLAETHGTTVTPVPRNPIDFAPPSAEQLADTWNNAGCNLAFFVNPHAPSGRLENLDYLEALAESFQGLLVIDEAYVDFALRDAVPMVQQRDDVILLRSLSKGYSLAGLRFGYGIADPSIIATLDKARDSYNLDILAQVAATAAIEHRDHARGSWQVVVEQRAVLSQAFRQRGFSVLDSHTNFLLAQTSANHPDAEAIYLGLKQRDILIRYFKTANLADRLRVTVGTPEQNQQLLAGLDAILTS